MNASERTGAALAVTATAMVGSVVAASSLLVDYPALAGQAGRYTLGAAVLAAVVRAHGWRRLPRLSARELGLVTALAASGLVGFNLCALAAVDRADPAVVGLVIGCTPVVLALVGPPLAGRLPTRRGLAAAAVVVTGAALAQGGGRTSATGQLLAVGALAGEAAFSLLAVPLLPKLGPVGLSAYVCAAAAILLAVAAVVLDGSAALVPPTAAQGPGPGLARPGRHHHRVRRPVLGGGPAGGGAGRAVRGPDPGGGPGQRGRRRGQRDQRNQAGRVAGGRGRDRARARRPRPAAAR
ncbi:MAG TPA: EamA family transporter [Actinomycetes bacterium]|nr:EamA family transporter [Actinomycetes bacterium]